MKTNIFKVLTAVILFLISMLNFAQSPPQGTAAINEGNISRAIPATLIINSVINSPNIITEPDDQTACIGSVAIFSVNATGTNLTYQWRKGTLNLINGGNISGATSATLTINPVTISDAASNYYVAITGKYLPDEYSINTSLRINKIPAVIIKPINQTVTIYPNPFTTSIYVVLNYELQTNNCEFRLYNAIGKELMKTTITKQTNTIETGNLPSGIYFYKIIENNKTIQSGRLVSQQ